MLPPSTRSDVLAAGGIVHRRVAAGRASPSCIEIVTAATGPCRRDTSNRASHSRPRQYEVREETGWEARPTSFLTATAYPTDEGQKYVLFWNMDAVAERGTPARGEVVTCEWLSPEAREKLTYPGERDIVAGLSTAHESGDASCHLARCGIRSVNAWPKQSRSHGRGWAPGDLSRSSPPRWLVEAMGALDQADAALADGAIDRGWALIHLIHELEVDGYDHIEVTVAATAIGAEMLSPKVLGLASGGDPRPPRASAEDGRHGTALSLRSAGRGSAPSSGTATRCIRPSTAMSPSRAAIRRSCSSSRC